MLITAEEYKRQFKIKDGRNSGIVSYILDPSDLSKALVDKIVVTPINLPQKLMSLIQQEYTLLLNVG